MFIKLLFMRKLFTLCLMLMMTVGIDAQVKKTWDFSEGLSYETIENLNADATHWASNGTDADGNTNNWKNVGKPDVNSYLMANGVVIPETMGLLFDIGSNKDNSIHLATTKMRLTRKNTTITFPKLANGQKITIVGRSANGTATNRGIAPVQDYIKLISGTTTDGACIFLGNQVDGSEGTYTFTWEVQTDSPDSVDVQFKLTPDGGIDFTLFMIDNGDAPSVQEAQKVAYLYNSSVGSLDDDYAYLYLLGDSRFEVIAVNMDVTPDSEGSFDVNSYIAALREYAAVVLSPTLTTETPYLKDCLNGLVAYVPVLNLNPGLYDWMGWGNASVSDSRVLNVLDPEYGAFEGLDVTEGVELLLDGAVTGVTLGDYFSNDKVVATAGNLTAMHTHNPGRNTYLLLPLTMENMAVANHDVISQLIPQALQSVIDTKQEVKPVSKPVISVTSEDGFSTVSISANHSTAIYYTLDGSDPTTSSTLYEGPFTLTQNTTVKAMGVGDGYTDSEIVSKDVVIMTQAAAPLFSVAREAGKSVVTLSSSNEGTTVYYNFNKSNVITESVAYTEPFEVTSPATVYAFVAGGDFLPSEVIGKFVGVDGLDNSNIRWDVMAHFDANADDWKGKGQQTDDAGNIVNANYFFTWGKNAGEYYDHAQPIGTVPGSDGQDSTVYAVSAPQTYEAAGWVIKSRGQVMVWESLNLGYNIGDTSMRNPDSADDVVGANDTQGITANAVTFGKQPSDGPFNATLETVDRYQAPFDVIIYAGNGNEGQIPTMQVEVSADGENWTVIGDVAYSLIKRNWKRTHLSYEGTDQVYVRIHHTAAKSSGQVYDVYLMNHGEYSAQYSEQALDGIMTIAPEGGVVRTEIFTVNGSRADTMTKGVNIIRRTYSNGAVKTQKVIVK